jgi:hypothetical protein
VVPLDVRCELAGDLVVSPLRPRARSSAEQAPRSPATSLAQDPAPGIA